MINEKIKIYANMLKKTGSFDIIGEGQHGIALLNKNNGLVYKITMNDSHEFSVAKKLKDMNLPSMANIHSVDEIEDIGVYTKPYYHEMNERLSELIGENLEEISDFMEERKNFDAEKSNTNLAFEFDNKFLNYLSQLKKDLLKLNLLPFEWDIDGLPLNTYVNNDNDYVLIDF